MPKEKPNTPGGTRERILATARHLFFHHGFENVSGDLLCKEAAISKTSIYRHFGDMLGVFTEVVKLESKEFALGDPPDFQTKDEFVGILSGFGARLLGFLNSKDILQFNRLMYSAAKVDRKMTRRFYNNAYQVGHDWVSALIESAQDKGIVSSDVNCEDLADYLISMWEGLPYIRARLSLTEKPYPNPKQRSQECVNLLFR